MKNLVEPIKLRDDVKAIEAYLADKSSRNRLIWAFGINTGLRVSDILGLNLVDVKNKSYVEIIEKKTKKYKRFPLNNKLQALLKDYLNERERLYSIIDEEPLFISKEPSINKKILLTADGSEGSKFAIKQALSLLNLKDKEIYVITVMEDITNLPLEITSNKEWFNDYLKKRNCFAQNVLRETGAMLKTHNLTAKEELMLIGPPSSTIIDTIKKEKIDLVVLGSRSKDRFSEFLLGSTSKRVLENVKSSVLIIAPQDTTETTSSEHTQEKY